jgi:hypothetical protein
MSNSFAPREFTIPPRREIRSSIGFSDKSAKKSRNFRCYAQKPSILPRSCPTCWDITNNLAGGDGRMISTDAASGRSEKKRSGQLERSYGWAAV